MYTSSVHVFHGCVPQPEPQPKGSRSAAALLGNCLHQCAVSQSVLGKGWRIDGNRRIKAPELVQVKRAARITNRCEPGRWLLQTQVRVSFGQHSIRLLFEVNLMVLLGVHVDVPDDTSEKCMWCFIGQQTQVLVHENDNIP